MASVPVLSGPVMALVLLLLIAGLQKIIDPAPTAGALRAAGLTSRPVLVRLLGGVEVVVAASWIAFGGPWPALMAAGLYMGFAWFVINALVRRLPISSCGCLGSTDTPPTVVHVVMNLMAGSVLVTAAILPVAPMGGLQGAEWSLVIPYALLVGSLVYMLYAILTVLPQVSRRRSPESPTFVSEPMKLPR